ncbi:MAG: AMP-binding protein, partial [Okeania sp. SIO1H6]|nr:AMP-binding protein [Okeania sp. SIO1H6]
MSSEASKMDKLSDDNMGTSVRAMSNGGLLKISADAPKTLAETLQRAAKQYSQQGITYIDLDGSESTQYYENLLQEAQQILSGLRKLGFKPQDKVIFQLERNQDFIAAFWGCILGGFVPVPISIAPTYELPNSTIIKLKNTWQMLGKPLILAGAKLAYGLRSLSELLKLESFQVQVIDDLRQCEPDTHWHPSQPDDLAILLLTSGSTGIPKAVMQSHRALLSRSSATAQMNKFTSDDISVNWFPLEHVVGLAMFHIRDVYLGCQQIHAPKELVLQQPLRWLDWIDRYQATITWAPNFAYGLINERAEELNQRNWNLSSMRFIINGGEAIVAKQARTFLKLLEPFGLSPNTMYPAWGMSEVCSGINFNHKFSLDSSTDKDSFVSVGKPVPGVSLRIANENMEVISEGEIGLLQVKGLIVTSGYYQNYEANQEAFTKDGWFNTGDLAFIKDGCLTITGRQTDIIIVNGINYYSHEIEAVVEELPGIAASYTAACPVFDKNG